MGKKEIRTERRIDYTKHEIAQKLNIADTTLDYQIKKMCEFYGLEPDLFKRNKGEGRNFFPVDYTSLLILLLKANDINPAAKKKTVDVTAKDVADFNKKTIEEIDTNNDLPEYLRETLQQMPWYREAGDISDWSALLVEELTQLIINLTKSQGEDIGQTIKYICKELDYMNYQLYRGSFLNQKILSNNERLQKENNEMLYQEFCDLNEDERKSRFEENPEFELFYNAYKQTKGNIPYINKRDVSIDRGVLSVMQAIMAGMGVQELQTSRADKLPEFLDSEEYEKLCRIMCKEKSVNEAELVECEREWYLNNQEDGIRTYIDMFLKEPGCIEASAIGKKWQSIPEKIESGTYFEDYREGYQREQKRIITEQQYMDIVLKLDEKEQKELFARYLEYFNANKQKEKGLHDIVSRFVGQVMLNYLSVSKEK